MDSKTVEQIAAPFQSFAAGGKFEAGQIHDGTVGRVLAGNPFRIVEREVSGLAGILSFAWKILRGAEVASTEMATVGGVADKLKSEKRKIERQITPRILRVSFYKAPMSL